jgi:hypothetical protein
MHGGAKGIGGQKGNRNAVTHGGRTKEMKELQRLIRATLKESKDMLNLFS